MNDLLALVTGDRQLGDRVKGKRGWLAANLEQQAVHLLIVSRNHRKWNKSKGDQQNVFAPMSVSVPPSPRPGGPMMETCLRGLCPPGSCPLARWPFAHPPFTHLLLRVGLRAGLCGCTLQTDQPRLPAPAAGRPNTKCADEQSNRTLEQDCRGANEAGPAASA